MARVFPTVSEQRKLRAELLLRLHVERLEANGCDEATVVAFTQQRIEKIRESEKRRQLATV